MTTNAERERIITAELPEILRLAPFEEDRALEVDAVLAAEPWASRVREGAEQGGFDVDRLRQLVRAIVAKRVPRFHKPLVVGDGSTNAHFSWGVALASHYLRDPKHYWEFWDKHRRERMGEAEIQWEKGHEGNPNKAQLVLKDSSALALATVTHEDPAFAARGVMHLARDAITWVDPNDAHRQAVEDLLTSLAEHGDDVARYALAYEGAENNPRDRFARLLLERSRDAWRPLANATPPETFEEATRTVETSKGDVLWADEELALVLEKIGGSGKTLADAVRARSAAQIRDLRVDPEAETWATRLAEFRAKVIAANAEEARRLIENEEPRRRPWPQWGLAWLEWLWKWVDSKTRPGHAVPGFPGIYQSIAGALWDDVLRPQLEREIRNPPSLVLPIHENVARVHSRVVKVEAINGQRALVFDDADPMLLVPSVAEEATQALVERGVDLLGTVTAHRALRWEVATGHERAMRGDADARVLRIDGGWSVFANEVLGLKSKAEADRLKAIVYAQDAVQITLPDSSRGRMLTLREWAAQGQRRGRIEIMLGTMLLPHYVHELGERIPKGRKLSEARRLIPVCDLPPFVGRNRDHGPQATLSMLVVRELRGNARELIETGAVRLPLKRWVELARKAGLPLSLLGKVLDRWTQDGPDAPAFLTRTGPDAYTLARTYARELAFIVDGARREVSGSHAGRRSVSARAAKMRRLARGEE